MTLKEAFINQHELLARCCQATQRINESLDKEHFGAAHAFQQEHNLVQTDYIKASRILREMLYKEFLPDVTPIK